MRTERERTRESRHISSSCSQRGIGRPGIRLWGILKLRVPNWWGGILPGGRDGEEKQMVSPGSLHLVAILCRDWLCIWQLVAGDQKLLGLQPEADQQAWSGEGYR